MYNLILDQKSDKTNSMPLFLTLVYFMIILKYEEVNNLKEHNSWVFNPSEKFECKSHSFKVDSFFDIAILPKWLFDHHEIIMESLLLIDNTNIH